MNDMLKRCMNRHCKRFLLPCYSTDDKCIACAQDMDFIPQPGEFDDGYIPTSFDGTLIDLARNRGMFMQPEEQLPIRYTKQKEEDDVFTCAPDVEGCPIAKKPEVRVPLEIYNQWMFIARQVPTEWIAYLKGDEAGLRITDMYFPKQRVTRTHVDACDGEIQAGTIGTVHSHNTMDTFFSAEDKLHMNHTIEIVVNAKGAILSSVRMKLECGHFQRAEGKILLTNCESEFELIRQLKEKTTEERISTQFEI